MNTITQIQYKGFVIEEETDPWAIKYGMNYRYYKDGERIYSASSIDEAKEEIDDKVMEVLPYHQVELNGRLYPFEFIEDAKTFASLWNANLYPIINA